MNIFFLILSNNLNGFNIFNYDIKKSLVVVSVFRVHQPHFHGHTVYLIMVWVHFSILLLYLLFHFLLHLDRSDSEKY